MILSCVCCIYCMFAHMEKRTLWKQIKLLVIAHVPQRVSLITLNFDFLLSFLVVSEFPRLGDVLCSSLDASCRLCNPLHGPR